MLQTKQIHDKENEATTKGGGILQQFVSGLVSDDVIHAVFAQHVKGKVGKERKTFGIQAHIAAHSSQLHF